MWSPSNQAIPTWLASLIALLVGLGTQSLLNAVIPAGAVQWLAGAPTTQNIIFIAGITEFWPLAILTRIVSFTIAGLVGVMLARQASLRTSAFIALVSLASVFVETIEATDITTVYKLYIWSLAAPIGVCIGAAFARFVYRFD